MFKTMGIVDTNQGKLFNVMDDFRFIDTHHDFIKDYNVASTKRVISRKAVGFEDDRFGQYEWNFTLVRK